MAKFYIQSGSVRTIVDCVDADGAALWAVNMVMEDTAPSECDEEDMVFAVAQSQECHLDDTIRISERGFDRKDALEVNTLDAFRDWFELFNALSAMSADWE